MIKLKDILNETPEMTDDYLLDGPAEEIVKSFEYGFQGFNTEEEAAEYLDDIRNKRFPDGLANIPPEMTLYRVILIQNGKKMDEEEVGKHFVADKDILYNEEFLNNIGIFEMLDWDSDNGELWLLTCKVQKTNLDLHETIRHRLMYPTEEEFTLKSPKGVRVIDKEQIELLDYLR